MPVRPLRTDQRAAADPYDRIIRGCLLAMTMLTPVFFLPFTTDVIELNKTLLFIVLALTAGVAWLLRAVLRREGGWRRMPYEIPLAGFIIFSILAAIFSYFPFRSIVGGSGYYHHALVTTLFLVFTFILFAHTVRAEHLRTFVGAFFAGGTLVVLFNFLQVFNLHLLPWEFAQQVTFNLVAASSAAYTVYLALLAVACMFVFLRTNRSSLRMWSGFLGALSVLILAVYDQPLSWALLLVGLLLLVGFQGMLLRELQPVRLLLPVVLMGGTLLALFINTQSLLRASVPADITLSWRTAVSVTGPAIVHRPVTGSGQGTFDAVFSMYRPASFNDTNAWNLRFQKSTNEWLQLTATIGVLGALAFLALAVRLLLELTRAIRRRGVSADDAWFRAGTCTFAFLLILASFFTMWNLVLALLFWMLLGASTALRAERAAPETVAPRAFHPLVTSLGFSALVVAGIVLLFFAGRIWIADASLARANAAIAKREDLTKVQTSTANAINLNVHEPAAYFALAQNLLVQAQLKGQEEQPDATALRALVAGSVAAAQTGASRYARYAGSYEALAGIDRSIDALSGVPSTASRDALTKATELDPKNPQLWLELGQYHLDAGRYQERQAADAKDDAAKKEKTAADARAAYEAALSSFQKAAALKKVYVAADVNLALSLRLLGKGDEAVTHLEQRVTQVPASADLFFNLGEHYLVDGRKDDALNAYTQAVAILPGYSDAHLRLGQLFEERKETDKAVTEYETVLRLNPGSTDVKKKIADLNGAS